MKIAILSFLSLMASSAVAFVPATSFNRGSVQIRAADPEEEEGLDLNLEEMFDM